MKLNSSHSPIHMIFYSIKKRIAGWRSPMSRKINLKDVKLESVV
ncbi:hypothetical protein [Okeania sp.]|nr:hypothetical protein [Okeania sp.]